MKELLTVVVITISMLFASVAGAQVVHDLEASELIPGSEMIRLSNNSQIPDFVKFRPGNYVPVASFIDWYKKQFQLSEIVDLKLISTEKDELGFVHYRYIQIWDNHPVEGSMLIVHTRNGMVESYNGLVFQLSGLNVGAGIDKSSALNMALNDIGADIYKWDLESEEAMLQHETGDKNATFFPSGELVLAPRGGIFKKENLDLAYKFDIYAHEPLSRDFVFVSATSGDIIWKVSRIHTSDSTGTAVTKYSGTQPIVADYQGPGNFRLREYTRGNGIETYDMNNGTNYANAVDFTDTNNVWNNVNPQQDEVAGDAHWGTEMTYDYFFTQHNRNSIDDNGFLLKSYIHYSTNYVNAFWDGQRMTYGDGNATYSPLVTMDICAHEMTHGITSNTSGLIYSYESGALNESFSDIFGTAVEFFAKPTTANWTMGEEIGSAFRSLVDPNAHNDPDTYLGTYWHTGAGDNGGVHTNSGVQNYWYYVLAMGDTAVNDNADAYSLPGIGITKASEIAYRNLTHYLIPSSQYADARFYAILSAQDLYGSCSIEEIATTNAWYAVGVGDTFGKVDVDFTADRTLTCSGTVRFKSQTSADVSGYLWDFGDGNSSILEHPVHTYSTNGIFDVKLKVTYCGFQDSLSKATYINVSRPVAPSVTGASVCDSGSMTLMASGSGVLNWYDAPTGGNLIHTGSTYMTPVLDSTTSYYVEEYFPSSAVKVGPPDNTFGTGAIFHGDHRYLIFDCQTPVKLHTVKVYADLEGDRTIQLRRNDGSIIQDTIINIPIGESKITLNFNIPVDSNLVLAVSGLVRLYRNNSNVSYPYTAPGLLSITRSNAGNPLNFYYFFYDWEIQEEECKSLRSEVVALVNVASPASITVHGDSTICQNDSVRLESLPAVAYQWSNGASTQDIWVSTTGTYIVSTVDSNGCSSTSPPQTVTVLPLPPADAGNNTSICDGDTVLLAASGGASYQWEASPYLDCINCQQTQAFPISTSTFYVAVTDGNGCTANDSVVVSVNSLPSAWAGIDTSICLGNTTQLQASGGISYQWSPAVGLSNPNIANPIASPSSTTTYTVAVTDNNGCGNTDDMTITILPAPIANAGHDTSICLNDSVQLNATGGISYSWVGSNLSCQNCPDPIASPAQTTSYVVTVTDAQGCQDNDILELLVNTLPNASAGSDQGICHGDSAQLSASGGVAYLWTGPGLSCSNCPDPVVHPLMTSTYEVQVTGTNGCLATDDVEVNVSNPPNASAGSDQSICLGDSAQLGASGGSSYSWNPSTGISNPVISNPKASPANDQTYVVTVTNQFGCSAEDSLRIMVIPLPVVTAIPDTLLCVGNSVQLFASGAISYVWTPAAGLSNANIANPIATVANAGTTTYVVNGTSPDGCVGEASVEITALDYATADFAYLATGLTVSFTNQSTGRYWFDEPKQTWL